VLHDDLQPDHIIITPSSGRLAGIIDWGLGLGDPAQDLTFILPWRGWDFTTALLGFYSLPLDDDFLERLGFLCRVRALGSLGHAILGRHSIRDSLDGVENAFAGGSSS